MFEHRIMVGPIRVKQSFIEISALILSFYSILEGIFLMWNNSLADFTLPAIIDLLISLLALYLAFKISKKSSYPVELATFNEVTTNRVMGYGLAPRSWKKTPDQLPPPSNWSQLSQPGEKEFENLEDSSVEDNNRSMVKDVDPVMEKILKRLASALEPYVREGYKVTSIEVHITPQPKDAQEYSATRQEPLPVTAQSQ